MADSDNDSGTRAKKTKAAGAKPSAKVRDAARSVADETWDTAQKAFAKVHLTRERAVPSSD